MKRPLTDMSVYTGESKSQSFEDYRAKEYPDLRIKYILEYVDNAKDWDRIVDGSFKALAGREAWEYYKRRELHDVGFALELYTTYLFRPNVYDVKIWEEIYNGDEQIYGQYIEPSGCYYNSMRKIVCEDTKAKLDSVIKENKELVKANELLQEFVDKVPSLWKEFQELKAKEV